jgi:hypothetical protein
MNIETTYYTILSQLKNTNDDYIGLHYVWKYGDNSIATERCGEHIFISRLLCFKELENKTNILNILNKPDNYSYLLCKAVEISTEKTCSHTIYGCWKKLVVKKFGIYDREIKDKDINIKGIKNIPPGLENVFYYINSIVNDIKNARDSYISGYHIWKYGKYYIATVHDKSCRYISYLLKLGDFFMWRPEGYNYYKYDIDAFIEISAIKKIEHTAYDNGRNWKKEVVISLGISKLNRFSNKNKI